MPLLVDSLCLWRRKSLLYLLVKWQKSIYRRPILWPKIFLASEQMTPPPRFWIGDRFLCCGRNVSSGQITWLTTGTFITQIQLLAVCYLVRKAQIREEFQFIKFQVEILFVFFDWSSTVLSFCHDTRADCLRMTSKWFLAPFFSVSKHAFEEQWFYYTSLIFPQKVWWWAMAIFNLPMRVFNLPRSHKNTWFRSQ